MSYEDREKLIREIVQNRYGYRRRVLAWIEDIARECEENGWEKAV